MALVIDLSFMLPRFDLISSSSSAGLTKWKTLSSSNRAFPTQRKGGKKQHIKLSPHNSAVYLFIHALLYRTYKDDEKEKGCQLNWNAEKNTRDEMLNNLKFWNAHEKRGRIKVNIILATSKKCAIIHKAAWISMLNQSWDVDKSPPVKKQRNGLYSQTFTWSVLVCVRLVQKYSRSSWFSWFWS